MANKLRGEVEVTLFNNCYTLRPDIESIVEIEDAAGGETTVPLMFLKSMRGIIGFKMIGLVLYGSLRAAGEKSKTFKEVLEEVQRRGVAEYVTPVGKLLSMMCTKEEAEAEAKAEEKAKAEPVKMEPEPIASIG